MLEVVPLSEPARWEAALARLPARDVFYRHAYARLCHDMGDGDPLLFAYDGGTGQRLAYVCVRRPLEGGLCDLITPNRGYGGPLPAGVPAGVLGAFRAELDAYCRRAGVVSEFVRFHPLLDNQRGLEGALDVAYDRETVAVALAGRDEAALLARYHHNHQRNVRKAARAGLVFRMWAGEAARPPLEAFYALYVRTMDKLHAARHAYFSLGYVHGLFALFGEDALLGAVFLDGRMVSGAVCLREGPVLHYHLGGSEPAAMRLGTNVYQFHHVALWGARHGCDTLHLGGGHVGRDALFEFKHRFAPDGLCRFYVGRKVHAPDAYARLVEAWSARHGQPPGAHFFPAYRAPPPAAVPSVAAPAAHV